MHPSLIQGVQRYLFSLLLFYIMYMLRYMGFRLLCLNTIYYIDRTERVFLRCYCTHYLELNLFTDDSDQKKLEELVIEPLHNTFYSSFSLKKKCSHVEVMYGINNNADL